MTEIASSTDIVVIGAGIAGASLAAEVSASRRVVLLERESQPGYHTTGRSAALFTETYGPQTIRALTRASAAFFETPPAAFAENPLLGPRGVLMIARPDQLEALDRLIGEVASLGDVRRLEAAEARTLAPLIRADYLGGAMYEPGAHDVDVHALHHGYLRRFRANGGELMTNATVRSVARDGAGWRVQTDRATIRAEVIVNAAGAWADEIGSLAGAAPVGLVPKRRTALTVAAPEGLDPAPWPMVVDIDEGFYMKPDAGRLLLSPADETPSPPCDAQPDEYDIALCIDRIQTAFDLPVRRIDSKWAGLRSFVADKTPVAGYDPDLLGFFWFAGQGGYGIQTAPALARVGAALLEGRALPADIADQGVTEHALRPDRFHRAA